MVTDAQVKAVEKMQNLLEAVVKPVLSDCQGTVLTVPNRVCKTAASAAEGAFRSPVLSSGLVVDTEHRVFEAGQEGRRPLRG